MDPVIRQQDMSPIVYPTTQPRADIRAAVRIRVPAEVWGNAVAAALEHGRHKSNRTRADSALALKHLVFHGIATARPTDGSGCARCVERAAEDGAGEELPPADPA